MTTTCEPVGWPILASYHYVKNFDIEQRVGQDFFTVRPRLFADCGAYSAMTKDIHIDVHEYGEWCLRWQHLFDVVASLDVIGSADASHENFETLRRIGVDCIPVFHTGDPWELLDHYISEGEKYIALGGMVGTAADRMRFIAEAMERLEDAPDVGFHGFGMTRPKEMISFKWKSVDSTSWLANMWGQFTLYNPSRKLVRKHRQKERGVLQLIDLIQDHGGDPEILYLGDERFHHESARVSATAWARYHAEVLSESVETVYLAGMSGSDMGFACVGEDGRITSIKDPDRKNGLNVVNRKE